MDGGFSWRVCQILHGKFAKLGPSQTPWDSQSPRYRAISTYIQPRKKVCIIRYDLTALLPATPFEDRLRPTAHSSASGQIRLEAVAIVSVVAQEKQPTEQEANVSPFSKRKVEERGQEAAWTLLFPPWRPQRQLLSKPGKDLQYPEKINVVNLMNRGWTPRQLGNRHQCHGQPQRRGPVTAYLFPSVTISEIQNINDRTCGGTRTRCFPPQGAYPSHTSANLPPVRKNHKRYSYSGCKHRISTRCRETSDPYRGTFEPSFVKTVIDHLAAFAIDLCPGIRVAFLP